MAANEVAFDFQSLLTAAAPKPAPKFKGFPAFNFIGGHNDPDCIPVQGFVDAATEVLTRDAPSLAIYNLGTGPQGYPPLREHVADKLGRLRGIKATADDILITHGSNQGIDLTCALLLGPGDTMLIEENSYSGALSRFRDRGATLVPVKLDEDGIVVADLAQKLEALKAGGIQPKLIYTIPTIQNPTGSILPLDRRLAIIALAHEYGVPIFEDECYADLIWPGNDAPPAFYALDPSCVIHIGSFSKSLAPALRLGYVVASQDLIMRMVSGKTDSGTGALDQMITSAYFSKHFDDHMALMKTALKKKMDVMIEAIHAEFGTDARIHEPKGGIFVWFDLPPEVDVRKLTAPAAAKGVVFNAGPEWSADPNSFQNSIRLCFALTTPEEIVQGVAKLAEVCHEVFGLPRYSRNAPRS